MDEEVTLDLHMSYRRVGVLYTTSQLHCLSSFPCGITNIIHL